jgi:hypothetical protein
MQGISILPVLSGQIEGMEPIDKRLWRMARKRADFKKGLFVYLAVNGMLWAIWWFTLGRHVGVNASTWPIYVTLGWGAGVVISYVDAYGGEGRSLTEREYEKLKSRQGGVS